MDFEMEIQAKNMFKFDDFEYEYEDDVFYNELRQQVLQLTAEDDEKDVDVAVYKSKNMNTAATAKKGGNDGFRRGGCYDWPPSKEEEAVAPAWIMNLWRSGNGNGTGVFIPQIVQSKKKNRPRRKRSERGRANRHVERI